MINRNINTLQLSRERNEHLLEAETVYLPEEIKLECTDWKVSAKDGAAEIIWLYMTI